MSVKAGSTIMLLEKEEGEEETEKKEIKTTRVSAVTSWQSCTGERDFNSILPAPSQGPVSPFFSQGEATRDLLHLFLEWVTLGKTTLNIPNFKPAMTGLWSRQSNTQNVGHTTRQRKMCFQPLLSPTLVGMAWLVYCIESDSIPWVSVLSQEVGWCELV